MFSRIKSWGPLAAAVGVPIGCGGVYLMAMQIGKTLDATGETLDKIGEVLVRTGVAKEEFLNHLRPLPIVRLQPTEYLAYKGYHIDVQLRNIGKGPLFLRALRVVEVKDGGTHPSTVGKVLSTHGGGVYEVFYEPPEGQAFWQPMPLDNKMWCAVARIRRTDGKAVDEDDFAALNRIFAESKTGFLVNYADNDEIPVKTACKVVYPEDRA